MGQNYDAREVVQRGTKLFPPPPPYGRYRRPSVRAGEVLVGILHNGIFVVAPELTSEHEFRQFHYFYSRGIWRGMELYALPKTEVENCQGNGKSVSLEELTRILSEHPPKTRGR